MGENEEQEEEEERADFVQVIGLVLGLLANFYLREDTNAWLMSRSFQMEREENLFW